MSWVEAARPIVHRLTAGAKGQSIVNLGLHVFSTALGFVASVLASRLLGAEGMGVYAFCFAVGNVLGVVGRFGLVTLMVREIAVARERAQWGLVHGMLRWGEGASLAASFALSSVAALVGWRLWSAEDPDTAMALVATAALVTATTGVMIRSAALQGIHQVTWAQFSGSVVRPVLFVAALAGLLGAGFDAPWAAVLGHAVGYAGAWLVAAVVWVRHRPAWAPPAYRTRAWLASAAPLMLLAALNLLNTQADTLMLKVLADNAETGIYAAAAQVSHFTAVVLTVVNAVVAPRFASLYARGDLAELQRVVTRSITAVTLATLPVAAALLGFGPFVLAFFGPEFGGGMSSLAILVAGQVANALCGSVGTLLVMCGHEREVGRVTTATALLNIGMNAALIPVLGAPGAATATTLSLVLWNVVLAWRVRARLGLDSTVLGAFRAR